jgi:dTDP-4-amino-4,6-dideoxygalactose transaminase
MIIPFNIPYSTNKELEFIKQAIENRHLSGNGPFTLKCREILEVKYGFNKSLLTTSCTDALEMSALLVDIQPGDEVIVPSYTFVSTALAFTRQGATIVFADSQSDNPCIDEEKIEDLITSKTKAIVPVHYAGISYKMDKILEIAAKYNLWVIEDAAHAFGSKYKGKLVGTFGTVGCFSFYETKIVHCGEGGMIVINDKRFIDRAEILWDKGTNRSLFQRGLISKYEWIDTGSSFLLSDLNAAFLYAQLEEADKIISHKKKQWDLYYSLLKETENSGLIKLPAISNTADFNYSGFYIEARNKSERENLRNYLIAEGIQAVTHSLDLSSSPYILKNQEINFARRNMNSKRYENSILRLPFFYSLMEKQIREIARLINEFYSSNKIVETQGETSFYE